MVTVDLFEGGLADKVFFWINYNSWYYFIFLNVLGLFLFFVTSRFNSLNSFIKIYFLCT